MDQGAGSEVTKAAHLCIRQANRVTACGASMMFTDCSMRYTPLHVTPCNSHRDRDICAVLGNKRTKEEIVTPQSGVAGAVSSNVGFSKPHLEAWSEGFPHRSGAARGRLLLSGFDGPAGRLWEHLEFSNA